MLEGALCLLCGGDVKDVLQPWCGCDGSRQSLRAALFGRGGGGAKLPSLLDAMRNSSAESSIMAHRGVEPMKATPA
jgi:hypothetical protein